MPIWEFAYLLPNAAFSEPIENEFLAIVRHGSIRGPLGWHVARFCRERTPCRSACCNGTESVPSRTRPPKCYPSLNHADCPTNR